MPVRKPRKRTKFKLPVLAIIINEKNEVLLIRRNNPKSNYSHLKWAFPGGGIEYKEHPSETIKREALEEVGIEIDVVENSLFLENYVFERERIHVLCICYFAKHKSGEVDISKDRKIKEAKWFKVDEIDYDTCLPKTKEILNRALKYI